MLVNVCTGLSLDPLILGEAAGGMAGPGQYSVLVATLIRKLGLWKPEAAAAAGPRLTPSALAHAQGAVC